MAQVHDIFEIGAGDIAVYDLDRTKKEVEERKYIKELSSTGVCVAAELEKLWEEYGAQRTNGSRWVKVVDRFLPFLVEYCYRRQKLEGAWHR